MVSLATSLAVSSQTPDAVEGQDVMAPGYTR
jgi:hypothetical protein